MAHDWRAPSLGVAKKIGLSQGMLRYWDSGQGSPIVFAHGWLANANLWRKVVAALAPKFRCVVPDLPFGAHTLPMRADAELTPAPCGALIAEFLGGLRLDNVTLVGNDSGGAYSQIATSVAPARIARLVLNSCETPYDPFPPPAFMGLKAAAQDEALLGSALQVLRQPEFRASPQGFGHLIKRLPEDRVMESYALPILSDPGILHDAAKVMRSADQNFVSEAGEKLIAGFEKPVLFVWPDEDHFFPLASVRRYAAALKNASVVLVEDGYSFTPEDQPEKLAALIAGAASGN